MAAPKEKTMPHYLFRADYTQAGLAGMLKDGAASRVKVVGDALAGLGGRLESMYFTFGDADVVVIAELPDNTAAAAFSTRVGAAGGASVSTTVLITATEVDAARGIAVTYRAPGG